MYVFYNPNPTGRIVGDCSVRAVAKALDTDWDCAYIALAHNGLLMGDMPSADSVWGSVLRENGFKKTVIPDDYSEIYTAEDYARDNPYGISVLGFGGHVATIKDGVLYDTWDSSSEIPIYVWRY